MTYAVDEQGEPDLFSERPNEDPDEPEFYACEGHGCGELFSNWEDVQAHLEQAKQKD